MQSRHLQQVTIKRHQALNIDKEIIIDTNDHIKDFIDRIMPEKSLSLISKIEHFYKLRHEHESNQSLKYLLGRAYIADKQFYKHLESIILKLDDVQYFHELYSYNPYVGKQALLIEACSYLFDTITRKFLSSQLSKVMSDKDIRSSECMIDLENWTAAYGRSIIQYQNVCKPNIAGVIHPIFALVKAKLWDQITALVTEDPSILLMSDNHLETKQPNHNLPFITSILIYTLEGKENPESLKKLQQCSIEQYLSFEIYKKLPLEHRVYEPQIALFMELQHNNAIHTRYWDLIEDFRDWDHKLQKNYFLQARINSELLEKNSKPLQTTGMISFASLILLLPLPKSSRLQIKYSDSQLDILPKDELIVELYSGVIIDSKVSEQAIKILGIISSLLRKYETNNIKLDQQRFKSLDQLRIGEKNLIQRMLEDYLKLYFAHYEPQEVINELYKTIITIVNNESFNAIDFVIQNSEVFDIICNIPSRKLLNVIKNKIFATLNPEGNLKIDNLGSKLLANLVPNAITAIWRSNKNNSHQTAVKHYIEVTIILNEIILQVGKCIEEPAISLDSIHKDTLAYLTCSPQKINIQTIAELDLQFKDGQFNLNYKGKPELCKPADYVQLYNFYSGFLMYKLYLQKVCEYEAFFKKASPQIEDVKQDIFSWFTSTVHSYGGKSKQQEMNQYNIVKGINLFILYLSNSKNQFKLHSKEDNSHLQDLFNSLERNHPLFQQITNATSELWRNIYMTGSYNTMQLLKFFKEQKLIGDITYIIPRCMKAALMAEDFHGFKMWINYSLSLLSEENRHNEIISLNVRDIRNPKQLMIVHDALLIATTLNLPYGVEIILSDYKNFLLTYQDQKHFSKYTIYPFDVINTLRKSKIMEVTEFRESLSKITVMLLEHGYPIEMIEKLDDSNNVILFIQALMKEQMEYSAKKYTLNFIFQNMSGTVAQIILERQYYLDIYEKSFKFFDSKAHNNQIDISEYCHVFSSILQPSYFLEKLKKITFFTGLKIDFNGCKHREILIKQAKNINRIIHELDDKTKEIKLNKFNSIWKDVMGDEPMNFSQKPMNLLQNSEYADNNADNNASCESHIEHNALAKQDINFFFKSLYMRTQKQDNQELALYQMEKENSIRVIVQVKAAITTGAFICLNNAEARNALVTAIPAAHSILILAGSLITLVTSTVSATRLGYLILLSTAIGAIYLSNNIHTSIKEYQKKKKENMVQLNAVAYYDQYQDKVDQSITYEEEVKVYKLMVKLFQEINTVLNGLYCKQWRLMSQENFFSKMQRLGITPYDIDKAINTLRNRNDNIDEVNNSLLTIAYVMSFAAMYLKIEKIKPLIDKVHNDDKFDNNDKQKFKNFLYKVLMGKIKHFEQNFELALTNMGLEKHYSKDLEAVSQEKVSFIIDSYKFKKSNQYSNLWQEIFNREIHKQALQKLDMLEHDNLFIKFILISSQELHCQVRENDIGSQNIISLF